MAKKTTPITQADLEETLAAELPGVLDTALAKQKAPQVTVNPPQVTVNPPQVAVTVPDVKVPTPQVTVNVPEIKIPEIKVPTPQVTIDGKGITKEELVSVLLDMQTGLVKSLANVFRDAVADALKAALPASSPVKIWNNTVVDTRNKKLLDELNRLQEGGETIFAILYRGVTWQSSGGGNMPIFSIVSYKLKEG